jgi:murein L,D-transpeptidase YcbB/YkuD
MVRLRPLALGMAVSVVFAVAGNAQESGAKRLAATEPMPATAPAVAPAPAPQDPIGAALQQKLAINVRADDGQSQDRAAAAAYYAVQAYAPLWVGKAGFNDKARALIAELGKANEWGLDAADFPVPVLAVPANGGEIAPAALADGELSLTLTAMKYARFARGGRIIDPSTQLSSYLDRKPQLIEPKTVIEKLASASDAGTYLRGLNPQHPGFHKLRLKYLEMLQAKAAEDVVRLPNGGVLSPGKSDPQVALLRKRLKAPLPAVVDGRPVDENFYDEQLRAAVVAFQKEAGTRPDGYVGNATRALLNDVETLSPAKLIANMEEWRWMPEDLGNLYVIVNIPEFTMRIVRDGAVIHTERVITGLPSKQTPVFSEVMTSIAFQPRWNVPDSIKVGELYPSLARGGTYFSRQGLRISKNGRDIDPNSIDWGYTDIRAYDVYQPPGAGNVLGELKFNFRNKHLVYMHDTNARGLFEEASRPFSHGCVRVRNPRRMAEILLGEDKGWDSAKIADLITGGPSNNEVPIEKRIDVHMTYFTAWVDDAGELQTARDVYGHEQRITLALEGRWSQIAKGPNHLAPVKVPDAVSYAGGNPFKSVGDFINQALGGF